MASDFREVYLCVQRVLLLIPATDVPDPKEGRGGGGCDTTVLTVGVCLVVVGTLMILIAVVIAAVALMCLLRPQGKYAWKSKMVT